MADSKYIIAVDEAGFEQAVLQASHQTPVLVDFWAEWCAPCKNLMPVLAKLAEEYAGRFILAKVNSDENQRLAMQCGIRSLPTVLLFADGQLVDGFVGQHPEASIRAFLDRHVPAGAPEPEVAPSPAVPAADRQTALAELRDRLAKTADDLPAATALARMLIEDGAFDEAEQTLQRLPEDKRALAEPKALEAMLRLHRAVAGAPAEPALAQRLGANPGDSEAGYLLGVRQALNGQYESGLATLLALVRRDRGFGEGAARKAMVDIFAILGSGPLLKEYRSLLYSALN